MTHWVNRTDLINLWAEYERHLNAIRIKLLVSAMFEKLFVYFLLVFMCCFGIHLHYLIISRELLVLTLLSILIDVKERISLFTKARIDVERMCALPQNPKDQHRICDPLPPGAQLCK